MKAGRKGFGKTSETLLPCGATALRQSGLRFPPTPEEGTKPNAGTL